MSSFSAAMIGATRLKMLQLLAATNGYSLNHELMQRGLWSIGIRLTFDQVRAELSWLESVRAVTVMDVGPMLVAELSERGHDVAKGLSVIPGIDRPIPGAGL